MYSPDCQRYLSPVPITSSQNKNKALEPPDDWASCSSHFFFFCTTEVGGSFMPPGDYAMLLHTTGMIVHTRGNKGKRETEKERG